MTGGPGCFGAATKNIIMSRFLILIFIIFCFGAATKSTSSSTGRVVEYLPGFQGPLPFYLETGYVGVDENEDVQLFYYFMKSESNPKHDPLLLWITGGPGCSSISDLIYTFGPLQFDEVPYNGSLPNVLLRPDYSWTKVANMIFLDIPIGTGFSYARTENASISDDTIYSEHVYEFIKKWLGSHPEFIFNPLYLGGGSYSGISVALITQLISDGNEDGNEPYINLKGYVLGNPSAFPAQDNYQVRFANGMGLISDELYQALFNSCRGEYRLEYINSNNLICLQNLELFQECIDGIFYPHILQPDCSWHLEIKLPSQKQLNVENDDSEVHCLDEEIKKLSEYWANDVSVREALHIHKGSIKEWERCSSDLKFTKTIRDVRPYHQYLSSKGYRYLIFSGDHDMVIPQQSTLAWIKDLNYPIIDQWRSWKLNGQIAGYTESYSNMMTFATVKGAGHTAPEDKPEECFVLFKRWISNQPL